MSCLGIHPLASAFGSMEASKDKAHTRIGTEARTRRGNRDELGSQDNRGFFPFDFGWVWSGSRMSETCTVVLQTAIATQPSCGSRLLEQE